jgi:hypothetical protein
MITLRPQHITACPLSLNTTPSPMARRRHQVPLRNNYSHNLKWQVIRLSQKHHNGSAEISNLLTMLYASYNGCSRFETKLEGLWILILPPEVFWFSTIAAYTMLTGLKKCKCVMRGVFIISHITMADTLFRGIKLTYLIHRTSTQLNSAFLRSNTTFVATDRNSVGSARATTRQLHMCSCTAQWIR